MTFDSEIVEREQGLFIFMIGSEFKAVDETTTLAKVMKRLYPIIAYIPEPSRNGKWGKDGAERIGEALFEIILLNLGDDPDGYIEV